MLIQKNIGGFKQLEKINWRISEYGFSQFTEGYKTSGNKYVFTQPLCCSIRTIFKWSTAGMSYSSLKLAAKLRLKNRIFPTIYP